MYNNRGLTLFILLTIAITSQANECQRNEIFHSGQCLCEHVADCNKVTPFYNYVITTACIISTVAIAIHVFYSLSR